MYHHLAQENGNKMPGQNLITVEERLPPNERHEAKTETLFFNLALLSLWGHS